ncbi:MAG: hypothetical protein M3512_10865 [Bacteroidota bacterium]|nr:hypothetical protein [Bacteroidota bacterium]
MLKQKYILIAGICIALLIIAIQFYIINNNSLVSSKEDKIEAAPIELAKVMFHNQRYMDKLYFSGINENWEAAEFYHHELEENMEVLLENTIVDDGIDISNLSELIFTPAILSLKTSIASKKKDVFLEGYKVMVNSCNSCHNASKKGFIIITLPASPAFKNQEF